MKKKKTILIGKTRKKLIFSINTSVDKITIISNKTTKFFVLQHLSNKSKRKLGLKLNRMSPHNSQLNKMKNKKQLNTLLSR